MLDYNRAIKFAVVEEVKGWRGVDSEFLEILLEKIDEIIDV